jgi:flagellar biosynthesis chaperone FliJ
MNNPALQQTLDDIIENLKELDSARTQVTNLSAKSEKMVIALTEIMETINKLQGEYSGVLEKLSSELEKNMVDFKKSLNGEMIDVLHKHVEEIINKHQSAIDSSVKVVESFNQKLTETQKKVDALDFNREFDRFRAEQKVSNQKITIIVAVCSLVLLLAIIFF